MIQDFAPTQSVSTIKTVEAPLSGMSTRSGNRFFDNSTLDSMRVCPRRFYYSKIRRWKPDYDSIHLLFGSAWHASMDYLWQNPFAKLDEAFAAFEAVWNSSQFAESESFDTYPKTPGRAREVLAKYIERYAQWLQNNIEVIEIEHAFIVPLSESDQKLFYVGKWDKLYKEGMFYHILDHKTTSSFSTGWLNSWSPNGQVDGYLYSGHMQYGEKFKSVVIDGALIQKSSIDFKRVPVERQIDMLDQWKWEVLDLIELVYYYENQLKEIRNSSKQEKFLRTFPKCTTSCTSYFGSCPFLDLCKFVPNPEIYAGEEKPHGFVTDDWKPFSVDETPEGEFVVKPHEGEH